MSEMNKEQLEKEFEEKQVQLINNNPEIKFYLEKCFLKFILIIFLKT